MAPPGEVMGLYANKLAHHYSPNTSAKYWSNKRKASKLQQWPLSRFITASTLCIVRVF